MIKYTRIIKQHDGSFQIKWSEDGVNFHEEIHRKIFVRSHAVAFVREMYPMAVYQGLIEKP